MTTFSVTIGSSLWNCGYRHTNKSRIAAFRKAVASVNEIPDATLRPTVEEMTAAYASLAKWDKRQRCQSPRMAHENSNRTWYVEIVREG